MTDRLTNPPRVYISSRETQTVTLNLTDGMAAGGVPSLPITTLYDVTGGGAVLYAAGLNGAPILAGLGTLAAPYTISQSVTALVAGRQYRLYWRWSTANLSPPLVDERKTDILVDE